MNKKIVIFTLLFTFLFGTITFAHSGRTDSSGGHNCSEKSQAKGLCSGYHYHNGGSSTKSSSINSSPAVTRTDKNCSDFASYDEVVSYWNSKGYSATNDPENLDGWGNGKVDDGIPCEAPSSYDKTKINNSPEQVQYKEEQLAIKNGEKQGYSQGVSDGYKEVPSNNVSSKDSSAFKQGYTSGYDKGYKEGTTQIEAEKGKAAKEGYALGQKQDNIAISAKYSNHQGLKNSFESGFNKAVTERVETKKKEYTESGYEDGKIDKYSPPTDVEEVYGNSYQSGYEKGQNELKQEYVQQGYEAAFTMIKYQEPDLTNEKFKEWHEEGFASNKEAVKIGDAGFTAGQQGDDLVISTEYKNAEPIYTHYYELGYKEYEEEQDAKQKAVTGSISVAALAWLGRRVYIVKKMIS